MTRKSIQPDALEAHLNKLKTIVKHMEEKSLSLDNALTQFSQGIELVRHCQKILSDAEQSVAILLQKEGHEQLLPFEESKSI